MKKSAMKGKIVITPRSLSSSENPHFDLLKAAGYDLIFPTPGRQPTKAEIKEFLPDCAGYLAGVETICADALKSAKKLMVISRNGTGINNIDLVAADRMGIKIMRTPGANAQGVAELCFALLLNCVRHIGSSSQTIKEGGWQRTMGIELQGRTLGLIGCGAIGKRVAKIATGFGMKVLAHDLMPDKGFTPGPEFEFVTLNDLFSNADFISLHVPAAPGGSPIINQESLDKMKHGIFIINTARNELIDEKAAHKALENGKIACLATDVFPKEPPELDPFLCHFRVIPTPHIGGFTKESVERATLGAVENLLKVLEKRA